MLDRLMRRAVFPVAHRIMCKCENNRQFHNRGKPDCGPGVVAEYEKCPSEGTKFRERQAVHDRSHCMFSYAEVQIFPSWIVPVQISGSLECQSRPVRRSEICGTTEEPRDALCEYVEYFS